MARSLGRVGGLMHFRMAAQRIVELRPQPQMTAALAIARTEHARFTTRQQELPAARPQLLESSR